MSLASNTIHSTPGSRKSSRRLGRGSRQRPGHLSRSRDKGVSGLAPAVVAARRFARLNESSKGAETFWLQEYVSQAQSGFLATLERICSPGDTVTVAFLREKGAVDTLHQVKVLNRRTDEEHYTEGLFGEQRGDRRNCQSWGNVVV